MKVRLCFDSFDLNRRAQLLFPAGTVRFCFFAFPEERERRISNIYIMWNGVHHEQLPFLLPTSGLR